MVSILLLSVSSAGRQDRTLHPRHGLRGHREEAGDQAEGALRQVCGHGHPGADQHRAPVLQQGGAGSTLGVQKPRMEMRN